LFITHDFGVVAEIADTVAVLQSGRVVEAGSRDEVLKYSTNLYTKMLLAAVPDLRPRKQPTDATTPVQLQATALTKTFQSGGWFRRTTRITAVDDVNLSVHKGETLGIVGESGSGKSTVARLVARLIEPSFGEVRLNSNSEHRAFRRRVQIVFQDPYRSLNPRRTIGASIMEAPLNFGAGREEARRRAKELMAMVQLSPAAIDRYPHEFSGGQRQRICIARAIAIEPEVLIADEAVSALDVSVQAQVLTLLEELRQRLHLTLIFITHDLRVAAQICNTVIVMRQGRVVELGPISHVFNNPQHEYTRSLLDAAPGRDFDFSVVR
jgi:peptide/nickel transport system ATP-binding protein